jgi:uncharacterized protein
MSELDDARRTGTPCWADVAVDDVDAASDFYTAVMGWAVEETPAAAGGYRMARIRDRVVAGIGPRMRDDQPVAWTAYLATDDVDDTAAAVTGAGGTVFQPPFDVLDAGRMAIAADSTGAVFGLWQPRSHIGYERVNEPGAVCWNEVHTRDAERATAFYADVFGYRYDVFGDPAEPYAAAKLDESDPAPVAGVFAPPTGLPEGVPGYWLTWFGVADTDRTTAAVAERGGAVLMGPFDSPFGRSAIVTGPQGEMFGVIAVPAD